MKKSNFKRLLQVALLAVLLVAVSSSASENLTVHFIDVGQGDSELLQFAGKNVLIDGGTQDMGPRVESYLRSHGVSILDLLVATHPHEDHIGGLSHGIYHGHNGCGRNSPARGPHRRADNHLE